jgi:hypothetical protein
VAARCQTISSAAAAPCPKPIPKSAAGYRPAALAQTGFEAQRGLDTARTGGGACKENARRGQVIDERLVDRPATAHRQDHRKVQRTAARHSFVLNKLGIENRLMMLTRLKRRRGRCRVLAQPGAQRFRAQGTGLLRDDIPVLEQHEGRNASDVVASGQFRFRLGVDL